MDLNKLNNIKNDILTDRTFREEQDAIVTIKGHNFIVDTKKLISLFDKKIEGLIININRIYDDTLQGSINDLVRNNIDADTYSLNFRINIPTIQVTDSYNMYNSDSEIFNYMHMLFAARYCKDNIELFLDTEYSTVLCKKICINPNSVAENIQYDTNLPKNIEVIYKVSMELTKLFSKYKPITISNDEKIYNLFTQNQLYNIIDALTIRLTDFGYKICNIPDTIDVVQDAKLIDDNYVSYTLKYIVKNPIK